jgi:hypothetical protein
MSDLGLFLHAIARALILTGLGPGCITIFLYWIFASWGGSTAQTAKQQDRCLSKHSLVDFDAHEPAPIPSRKAA